MIYLNIYEVSSYFYNEKESDNISIYDYVIHEKQFTKEEFNEMCKKGEVLEEVKDCFDLKRYLIQNHGFKEMKPIATYEFEEV